MYNSKPDGRNVPDPDQPDCCQKKRNDTNPKEDYSRDVKANTRVVLEQDNDDSAGHTDLKIQSVFDNPKQLKLGVTSQRKRGEEIPSHSWPSMAEYEEIRRQYHSRNVEDTLRNPDSGMGI